MMITMTSMRTEKSSSICEAPPKVAGPLAAHMQSDGERSRVLRQAGAIGAIAIQNSMHMDMPWERLTLARFLPAIALADPAHDDNRGPSDQYSFIRREIPSRMVMVGFDKGSPEEQVVMNWLTARYHAPSDDVNHRWTRKRRVSSTTWWPSCLRTSLIATSLPSGRIRRSSSGSLSDHHDFPALTDPAEPKEKLPCPPRVGPILVAEPIDQFGLFNPRADDQHRQRRDKGDGEEPVCSEQSDRQPPHEEDAIKRMTHPAIGAVGDKRVLALVTTVSVRFLPRLLNVQNKRTGATKTASGAPQERSQTGNATENPGNHAAFIR